MEINFDELRDWSDGARRALDRERERMMEQMKMLDGLARAGATDARRASG